MTVFSQVVKSWFCAVEIFSLSTSWESSVLSYILLWLVDLVTKNVWGVKYRYVYVIYHR